MRTRFLGLDFLNSSAPIETLDDFLRFPVTEIQAPPPSISTSGDKNLFEFINTDDVSILSLSSQLQSVHIDTALSKFYNDVLPHHVEVDQCCFSRYCSDEEESGTTVDGKGDNIFENLLFEMPELDISLGNVFTAQEQELKIFSNVSDVETTEDLLIPMLKMQDLCKIQEYLFAVENLSVEYQMDQSNFLLEDSSSFKGQNHHCYAEFPLFEVDVSSLGILSSISMDNDIKLFKSIEPQFLWAKDETLFNGKELLQFTGLDILKYLSCNSLLDQRLETDSVCSYFINDIDLFSVIEHEVVVEKVEMYQGRPENTYFCSRTPILYEELQFFDLLSFQFFEFFSDIEVLSEVEISQQMFCEASNVNNFNDLIVSHELTLVDDSFKSLPVPMFFYSEENSSVQKYLEEILAELKPLPSLTSDAIYLDWHIIEEDKCNSSRYSSCLKVLEELDGCSNNFNMKSYDAGMLILDSVLSDDNQNVPYRKEGREMLKIPSVNTSVAHVCHEETSSRVLNDGCQKRVKGESPCNLEKRDGDPQSGPIIGENNQKLEDLLNFVPTDEYNMGSPRAANCSKPLSVPLSLPCQQLDMETIQVFPSMSSFPDRIVVVNTQSVDNEMIISRRSTYQKILAMEKDGTQVVERDLHHPVDVIVSAAICLVWYDCRNIRNKSSASNEASSSLPLCIENIAANGLTALSFAFSGCILVFEGQSSFLGGVMESSDELYAAAASLGMDLQLFFSYTCDMTDEIILSCITHASKFRGLYPTMPESETLAESFLTTFPSLNPLSAHAILSSVAVLIEFLESSHTERVLAVQKYQVSDESIALLNACFRYGEREDCKSGTTECSSSVSSPPESDNCPNKNASEMRKRKYIQSTLNVDLPVDELYFLDTSKLFAEGRGTPKRMSKPNDTWLSEDPVAFNEVEKYSLSFENVFSPRKPESNIKFKATPSRMSKPCSSYMSKSRVLSEERDNNVSPAGDALLNQGPQSSTTYKFDKWNSMNSENFIQNIVGEVINIDDEHPGVEDSSVAMSSGLSYFKSDMEREPPLVFSKSARKLLFDNNSLPTFPRAAEIDYDTDGFISTRSNNKSFGEKHLKQQVFQNSDKEINIEETMFMEHQKYLLKEGALPKSVGGSCKDSLMENNMPYNCGTPLSNAIHFAQPQQGSPWTIEFLNRVREKSKLRQKSLPHDLPGPSFGSKGNISKVAKRRSPSILEFFKYQKGSNPNKRMEQKRQKFISQPSKSYNNEKASASFLPAMTPIDKRARQTLSFATPGSGGQSKLVWGDKSTRALKRQF